MENKISETDQRLINLAVRSESFKCLLVWMATEGRLGDFELKILKEELEKNLYETDLQDLKKCRFGDVSVSLIDNIKEQHDKLIESGCNITGFNFNWTEGIKNEND